MINQLNWLAVSIAAVTFFIIGGLWYAAVFNRPWVDALALNTEQKTKLDANFPKALGLYLLAGFLIAALVDGLAAVTGTKGIGPNAMLGVVLWLGLALPLAVITLMFEARPRKVFLLNTGNYLVSLAAVGAIIGIWR